MSLSFSDFTLAIRMAIARQEGQEECLLNLSVPRVGDPDDVTLVVRGLSFFLNSGRLDLELLAPY